jgi:hypothetical protein
LSTATATGSRTISARQALSIGSILSIVGAAGYVATPIVNSDATAREAFASPINIAGSLIATVGLLFILYAFARDAVPGPSWAVVVSATGIFFAAAMTWFFATGMVAVTGFTTDNLFDDISSSGWNLIMALPKMLFCLIGFLGLAIAGWKQGTLPRAACVFLALAAVASIIPPFPPGVILASIALLLIARSPSRE